MDGRSDEGGATVPLLALLIVALLVCSAFAVDLGALVATNRRLQAVADLAALDAGAELNGLACDDTYKLSGEQQPTSLWDHVRTAALESAARNGFVPDGTRTLSIALGGVRDGTFTMMMDESTPLCSAVPTAVRVMAANHTPYSFARVIGVSGEDSGREAVAGRLAEGAFVLGSALATISTGQSTLYNLLVRPVLETALCRGSIGCDVDVDLVGYNSLAGANLRLGDLAAEMGAGTPDDVFQAPSVTVGQFLAASATVLDRQGTTTADAAAAQLLNVSAELNTVTSLTMSDFVDATTGMGMAADTMVDALTLLRVAASVANGTSAITVPNANLNIPGVASIGLQLNAIEKPVVVIGPPSVTGTTTQAPITITVNLNTQVTSTVRVTGGLPVTTAADDCGEAPGITVDAEAQAVNLTSSGTLRVSTTVPIADLGLNGTGVATADPPTALEFDYPAGFGIPQRTGNTELGLNNIAYGTPTVTLLGLLPLPVSINTIMNSVRSVLNTVDTTVVKPLLEALGLNVGSASVTAIHPLECGQLRLFV